LVELLETQEMLNFCAEHNITADIELINVEQINEAFERLSEGLLRRKKETCLPDRQV
jgi:D-arabinose 1-dehydrogenase-like Zn-dependent alcohol dehydrogenase